MDDLLRIFMGLCDKGEGRIQLGIIIAVQAPVSLLVSIGGEPDQFRFIRDPGDGSDIIIREQRQVSSVWLHAIY